MQVIKVPSYTFLIGEYVGTIESLLQGNMPTPFQREQLQKRLKQLLQIQMHDLPLYQAMNLCEEPRVKELLRKALCS